MQKSPETETLRIGKEYIKKHNLPMKLLSTQQKDGEHLTFYFKSETRVDFRELVKDLNCHFKTKVELKQVDGREAARALGGIGRCGLRELCCVNWEPIFPKVSLNMIKELGLEGSSNQYIGACGRLMCCLAFELKDFKFLKSQESLKTKTARGQIELCSRCGRALNHTHIEIPKGKKEEPEGKRPIIKRVRRLLK